MDVQAVGRQRVLGVGALKDQKKTLSFFYWKTILLQKCISVLFLEREDSGDSTGAIFFYSYL